MNLTHNIRSKIIIIFLKLLHLPGANELKKKSQLKWYGTIRIYDMASYDTILLKLTDYVIYWS